MPEITTNHMNDAFSGAAVENKRTTLLEEYRRRQVYMRGWLHGREYYRACVALDWVDRYHTGLRKDGFTPEKVHPISVAESLMTLHPGLMFPEETYAVALLHDVREDYDVSDAQMRKVFGDMISDNCELLAKKTRGTTKTELSYFNDIQESPIASLVKGADRAHNHQTMVGVFTIPKQETYMEETKRYFFPMLHRARRLFPAQELAYQNLKGTLIRQIELIEKLHEAMVTFHPHGTSESA